MGMNNQDSLRTQIIEAMEEYQFANFGTTLGCEKAFDEAIMPVLDAAMKAGELLLHRATTPMPDVQEAIMVWLEGCLRVVGTVRPQEATVSKQQLLRLLYELENGAIEALNDARIVNRETTIGAMGNLLAGKSLPAKG